MVRGRNPSKEGGGAERGEMKGETGRNEGKEGCEGGRKVRGLPSP